MNADLAQTCINTLDHISVYDEESAIHLAWVREQLVKEAEEH